MEKFKHGDFIVTSLGIVLIKNEFSNNEYKIYLKYHFKYDYISFENDLFFKHDFVRYATDEEIEHIYELLKREEFTIDFENKEITNNLKIGDVYIFWNEYKNYNISILAEIDEKSSCCKYKDINGNYHYKLMKFKSVQQYKKLFENKKYENLTIGKQYEDTIYLPIKREYHIGQLNDDIDADKHIERLFKQGSGKFIKTYAKQYAFVDNTGKIDHIVKLSENHTWIVKKTNKTISVDKSTFDNAFKY